jgi:hypothetical protein
MDPYTINQGGGVLTFAYEAETTSAIAAMTAAGSTPNARRQYSYNRAIRRLNNAGILTKLLGFYVFGETEAQSLINLKSPGIYNLTKVGTPTPP